MELPQEMAMASNATDNRNGRVHSLFTAPVLQKSLHISQNRGSGVSSARNLQEQSKTRHLPKDKDKESPGNRLLNMLRRTLKGSESKELEVTHETPKLVPFGGVVGCLAIHVKKCRRFTPKISLYHYNNLFIRISINNIVKYTKMRSLLSKNKLYSYNDKNTVIKFDEVKYFSVQVPRRHDDERNNIYLELMQNDNKEKYPLLLGSVQVHLYEVIQKGCFTEEFQMLNKNTFICRVEVEFMFSYGNFGYGFSHQLKSLQKIIEPSMFMNVAPPPERTDPVTNVIVPQQIEYPAFLSPDLNVPVGMPNSVSQCSQTPLVRLTKLQQPPRERLVKMKKEYRDLSTWGEKATYLEGILNPKLEYNQTKGSHTNEVLESQFEEKPEDIITSDIFLTKEEAETIPSELLDNDDKKGLTLPTLNQSNQDNINVVAPKSDESTEQTDAPLIKIPSLMVTEENEIPPLEECQSEVVTNRKMSNILFQPEPKLKASYPNLLKTDRPSSEVAFTQKEYTVPSFRPECTEFKPTYQFQMFNKDSFDAFLRNINNKMSVRKRKDQDMSKCRNILSAEIIEYEDQDPPYPTHSETARLTNKFWLHGLDITTTETVDTKKKLAIGDPGSTEGKTLDTENKLARDPAITTIKTSNTKNNLKERLPNVSLPNFEGESPLNRNVNTYHLSKSLNLTSNIENLKQSVVLKLILSKYLQDLSDKLFSEPEVPMDTEVRKNSHSSLFLRVHDKPPSSLEDKLFEKAQDLKSPRLSKRDTLNSKSLTSPIIKDIPTDSLSKGGPGNSPEVGREFVSEKHLEAGEVAFPIKKKSSFKKKHLESEVSSSKPGFNDTAHDYVIKQIFTAPIFSELEMGVEESRETQMNWQNQYPTALESLSSNILVHYEENDDETELPEAKSIISQIIQAFPIDTLVESGTIKVIDKEYQKSSLLDTETAFVKEKPKDSAEDYLETKSKTNSLSKQNIPIIPKEATAFLNRAEFIDNSQNISPQNSKYQSTSDKKTDLPSNGQSLDREENDLNSTLENLSNLLMGKFNESDVMLKSFLKNLFNVFFTYQSERRQPEKDLERLIQHTFPNNIEDLEEIEENFDKADVLDRKPSLSPKLRAFLEELSESEIKNLKSELSKYIQHYLVERLSESGHITREDLTQIYQNLYLMNEEAEPKGQNVFLEKYSETVKETTSFVNNFNHHFIDKHLEIKLRSFLNDILQNYFLKNISESSLLKDTEPEPLHSNISSLRTKSLLIPFHKLGQDISRGSSGRTPEVNMKYPLNESLQNCLISLSENEILNLKAYLSKHLQRLFIEKLSKSGLISERQLEGISHHTNLINSSSTLLKCIKPDLSFRDENQFMEEHSEKQNKNSEIVHKTTLQKVPEDRLVETELTRKEEKEYFSLQNIKENPSIIREQKRFHPKEGAKTLTLIKVQTSSNKNTQATPLKKSSERLTDIVLHKERKEHGFTQLPQAENFYFKREIQDPHSGSGKSKLTQSNTCFEKTLKMKSLEKEYNDIYQLVAQEKPEVLSPYPRTPYCKMPNKDEEYVNKVTFPSRQNNILTDFSSEAGENSKLEDQHYQRLKGHNNKKQHLVTSSHYKKEIQAIHIKPNEICNEKCTKILESQSFKYNVVEAEKNSKPSFFPEVLKRENLKPNVRKERDHVNKQKKSFNKTVKILPTTPPTTRILRKPVPRTLLHWPARRTIHDCLDRFEDLHLTSFQHLEKATSRGILLGKSPDDSHNRLKHSARPYTAPEVNKRESYTGKFTSPRMVSAGLVHLNDTSPDYEIQKLWPKNN
ncbi:cation channel sperm-associated targeting subunit tau [Rhinolophus ferrumequinum]|uniref:cation channel sperm-associated targeting subunit tau n=1 Tax=Rhinolophus ferrumequinum TaxID=59479 RepID=UPI00140F73F8|nr:cation channel sperm-associated targeting subunit tau [Rhinolophus ferrumequinum]